MISAAIFDMDGLMFDTEPVWGRCWARAFARFGLEPPSAQFKADLRGTSDDTMRAVFERYLGPDVDMQPIYEAERALVAEENARHIDKKPGLDELLAYLRGHGVPMAVASSSPAALIAANLRVAGVRDHFCQLVSTTEVSRSKPHPDVFLEAARRLGVAPEHALVLEDSFNGVRAGRAGGFVTVMVPDQEAPDEEMRRDADAICASLADVVGLLDTGALGQGLSPSAGSLF